ncbi:hypothetical protein AX769_07420 [Frondihabitans sp. PAMC 28766]|uniref:GntR family transcriptional regulator n=1 Tax=Frondihabitans sp. PAMC 28766 TaxID=1795630 RepID=UPI00078C9A58|nr:GntR family transcriptional regulator [Frondihabitans sp. PAMC 28766]AMM20026.1 hypothetical protein AX769_07420 [Frondihabitans sp. PAMC 28766]
MKESAQPGAKKVLVPDAFQTTNYATTAVGLLREMILSGGFGPGERLNELAISEQLKISRSPIREALQALAGQGLVRFVAGRGAFVTDFDAESVRDLGEVRIALEARAARLAAARATDEQLAAIEKVLHRADSAIETGTLEEMLESGDEAMQTGSSYPPGLDFHHVVIQASHNPRLETVADEVATQFRLARARTGREAAWAPTAWAEHAAIFDAIRAGDGSAASAAMELHLENSTQAIIRHIESATA